MAVAGPNQGFGFALTFQSGFLAFIRNAAHDGISRKEIETSNNGTVNNARTFIPNSLFDPGELSVDVEFDPSMDWKTAIKAAAETVTATYPKLTGQTVSPSCACSGFLKTFSSVAPYDDVMTAKAVIKFTGPPTLTAAS